MGSEMCIRDSLSDIQCNRRDVRKREAAEEQDADDIAAEAAEETEEVWEEQIVVEEVSEEEAPRATDPITSPEEDRDDVSTDRGHSVSPDYLRESSRSPSESSGESVSSEDEGFLEREAVDRRAAKSANKMNRKAVVLPAFQNLTPEEAAAAEQAFEDAGVDPTNRPTAGPEGSQSHEGPDTEWEAPPLSFWAPPVGDLAFQANAVGQ